MREEVGETWVGGLECCLPCGRDHVLWVVTGGGAPFGLSLILSCGFPRRELELPPLSSAFEREGFCLHHPHLGLALLLQDLWVVLTFLPRGAPGSSYPVSPVGGRG